MNDFQPDPDLCDRLREIRADVERLFEHLRLRNGDGDLTGKKRLERVPALAKNNFKNLWSRKLNLAVAEAWRLIDFLEGSGHGHLSPLAREGLRVIELDKRLAALRASNHWMDAAARLRESLGVGPDVPQPPSAVVEHGSSVEDHRASVASVGMGEGPKPEEGTSRMSLPQGSRRVRLSLTAGFVALLGVGALGVANWGGTRPDPRFACIPLESASKGDIAAHRALRLNAFPQRPKSTDRRPRVFQIYDPQAGLVQSTWTTSQFSYAERNAPNRPGGGRSDVRLRVGGHGDTYLSLLHVPVPSDRLVHRAVIELTVLGDSPGSRPTTMSLRAINDNWEVAPGPNNRLWWRDCPRSEVVRNHLPPAGPAGSVYAIDITDVFNSWARGLRPSYGIMLEPEQIGSWRPGRPDYANFNIFYSTRARDPQNRPRLVLTY